MFVFFPSPNPSSKHCHVSFEYPNFIDELTTFPPTKRKEEIKKSLVKHLICFWVLNDAGILLIFRNKISQYNIQDFKNSSIWSNKIKTHHINLYDCFLIFNIYGIANGSHSFIVSEIVISWENLIKENMNKNHSY